MIKEDLAVKVQSAIDYVKSLDYISVLVGRYDISDAERNKGKSIDD